LNTCNDKSASCYSQPPTSDLLPPFLISETDNTATGLQQEHSRDMPSYASQQQPLSNAVLGLAQLLKGEHALRPAGQSLRCECASASSPSTRTQSVRHQQHTSPCLVFWMCAQCLQHDKNSRQGANWYHKCSRTKARLLGKSPMLQMAVRFLLPFSKLKVYLCSNTVRAMRIHLLPSKAA
jgi:hypothetical protein